jgi:hypothetical protein
MIYGSILRKALITCSLIAAMHAQAEYPPSWQVNPNDYENIMTVTGILIVNGSVSNDSLNTLAGFDDAENCRAVSQAVLVNDRWTYFLTVYGNMAGELIHFRYHSATWDTVLDVAESIDFVPDGGSQWTPSNPFLFHGSAINLPPIAYSQTLQMMEDSMLTLVLQGDDWNLEDTLSFEIMTNPQNGALSGTLPELHYQPELNFFGNDSFTFVVNDGTLQSEPATVSIEILPVNDPPGDFVLLSPPDNVTIYISNSSAADSLTFLWSAAQDIDNDLLSYSLIFSDELAFLPADNPMNALSISWSHENIAQWMDGQELLTGTWTVETTDGEYSVPAENVFTLTIDATGFSNLKPDGQIPTVITLQPAFPNPFNNSVSIPFMLPEAGNTLIEIFDLSGRKKMTLLNTHLSAGVYKYPFNLEFLGSGIYFLSLSQENHSPKMQKITVIK